MPSLAHLDDQYCTPPWLLDKIRTDIEINFTLDFASNSQNNICDRYLDEDSDALSCNVNQLGIDEVIFCNPPTSKNAKFVKKIQEIWETRGNKIVMLLRWNDLGNNYGQDILRYILSGELRVRNLGKVKFYKDGIESEFPSRLTYFYLYFPKRERHSVPSEEDLPNDDERDDGEDVSFGNAQESLRGMVQSTIPNPDNLVDVHTSPNNDNERVYATTPSNTTLAGSFSIDTGSITPARQEYGEFLGNYEDNGNSTHVTRGVRDDVRRANDDMQDSLRGILSNPSTASYTRVRGVGRSGRTIHPPPVETDDVDNS